MKCAAPACCSVVAVCVAVLIPTRLDAGVISSYGVHAGVNPANVESASLDFGDERRVGLSIAFNVEWLEFPYYSLRERVRAQRRSCSAGQIANECGALHNHDIRSGVCESQDALMLLPLGYIGSGCRSL